MNQIEKKTEHESCLKNKFVSFWKFLFLEWWGYFVYTLKMNVAIAVQKSIKYEFYIYENIFCPKCDSH